MDSCLEAGFYGPSSALDSVWSPTESVVQCRGQTHLRHWGLDPRLLFCQYMDRTHQNPSEVSLMLLEKDERRRMTQLFEHLSAAESTKFTQNDVQNLANMYI